MTVCTTWSTTPSGDQCKDGLGVIIAGLSNFSCEMNEKRVVLRTVPLSSGGKIPFWGGVKSERITWVFWRRATVDVALLGENVFGMTGLLKQPKKSSHFLFFWFNIFRCSLLTP